MLINLHTKRPLEKRYDDRVIALVVKETSFPPPNSASYCEADDDSDQVISYKIANILHT